VLSHLKMTPKGFSRCASINDTQGSPLNITFWRI